MPNSYHIYDRLDKIEEKLRLFEEKVWTSPKEQPIESTIENTDVKSSMISAYKYNPNTEILTLTFRTGVSYKYLDVPRDIMNKFQHADSYGKFINTYVKPAFKGEKIEDGMPEKVGKKKEAREEITSLPLDLVIELKQFAEANAASAAAVKTYIDTLIKRIEASQKRGV